MSKETLIEDLKVKWGCSRDAAEELFYAGAASRDYEVESLRQQVYNLNRLCEFDNKTNEQLLQIASDHLSGFVLCDNPPVAWTHSCNVLCLDNVELWIDRCPHCGKPAPKGMK